MDDSNFSYVTLYLTDQNNTTLNIKSDWSVILAVEHCIDDGDDIKFLLEDLGAAVKDGTDFHKLKAAAGY